MRLLLALGIASVLALPYGACAESVGSEEAELAFRSIGPLVGGRISRVAGVPGSKVFYAAAAQGGVWKSSNDGFDWEPIFDEEISQSIGSIAVAPSDPNVIYVGGGEANPRGNVQIGLGIWRSTDAGKSWTHVLKLRGQIGTIAVHPTNPDIAFAAVLGSPFGPGAARGVYRTTDGGATWQQVLKRDADTGASDVAIDPNNPRIVYAGLWAARRQPWALTSGNDQGGLFRSTDGGASFEPVSGDPIPTGVVGKVGVAVAPSDSSRVYALIESEHGGLFRSDDGGLSWSLINEHRVLRQRPWYYSTIVVDPHDPDTIWFPQVPLLKSVDGGKTVVQVDGPHHGDHHDLWIDPKTPGRMINGNDGGIDVSLDGSSWFTPLLPLAQFYNIDVDDRVPYHVGGTIQDWGTASGPSEGLNGPVTVAEWRYAGGGEAGDFVYDPFRPGHVYAGEYMGYLSHYVEGTGQYRNISVELYNASGKYPKEHPNRFQWTAPAAASPHAGGGLYHGGNRLFRTLDQGQSWTAISPDLTRDDKTKQQWSGGPITGDITGVETYDTIFSIAESPAKKGVIYVGSDDGLVHVSEDDGGNWRNITPRDLPEWATIEGIEPSARDAGSAWIVAHRYRLDDARPYLFRTRDYGKTWQKLGAGLPDDLPLWSVRVDPADDRFVYLGTDRGVWYSRDGGAHFSELALNLPKVAVVDLVAKHGDLVLGTRGRGLWVLDNLATLRALDDGVRAKPMHLFASQPAYRFREDDTWSYLTEDKLDDAGTGVDIHYWLKNEQKEPFTLRVLDAEGQLVRTLSSEAKPGKYPADDPDEPSAPAEPELANQAGINTARWDLRHEGAKRLVSKIDMGNPESGPLAVPGIYTLELVVGTETSRNTVEIKPDPRSPVSAEDTLANVAFTLGLRDGLTRLTDAVHTLQSAHEQLTDLQQRIAGKSAQQALADAISAALKRIEEVEQSLHNRKSQVNYDILSGRDGGARLLSQMAPLYSWVQSSDHAPTNSMKQRAEALNAELASYEAMVASIRAEELAQVEAEIARLKLPRVMLD